MISVANKKDLDTELNKTRVTIALFYASWCPHCVRFVPFFDKQASCRRLGNVIHVLLDDYDNPLWDNMKFPLCPP